MPDPIQDVKALQSELAALKAEKNQADLDEQEALQRVRDSYGALTIEQARQVVKYQRDWEKDPKHPDNVAKAKASAK